MSANFFLRNQLQFSRGIQCVSHPVSTLSSNILRLEQPTCLSYTVSYRFVCWHQASISHSLHSPKSVPIQRYQFRHLSSLLPPRSFESLMRIKVVLLRHESLEKWRDGAFCCGFALILNRPHQSCGVYYFRVASSIFLTPGDQFGIHFIIEIQQHLIKNSRNYCWALILFSKTKFLPQVLLSFLFCPFLFYLIQRYISFNIHSTNEPSQSFINRLCYFSALYRLTYRLFYQPLPSFWV